MAVSLSPSSSRALLYRCPICPSAYASRKLLLEYLRSDPEGSHKTLRFGACQSIHYPHLVQQGVLACPRGCGSFFNGGDNGVSKPLDIYIARGNCRDRRPGALPQELAEPYLATSNAGVRTTLAAQASRARMDPGMTPPHSAAVGFCCAIPPGLTPIHMRTS
jgi:hypothetical protein